MRGSLGNLEKALEVCLEAMRMEPNNETSYANLGNAYVILNRLGEAAAVYKSAGVRKLESEALLQYRYQLAFLEGDTAQMAPILSPPDGKPATTPLLLPLQPAPTGS